MSKILHESLYSFKSSRIVSLLIVFVVAISCFLSTFSYSIYREIQNDVINFSEKNIETQYYRLGDNFIDEYEQNFKSSENYIAKLKGLYHSLSNSDDFKYYELHSNTINLYNAVPDNKFLKSYSTGNFDMSIIKVDESLTIYQVNGIYVGDNVFSDFQLNLDEGVIFNQEDYKLEKALNTKEIPVILGAEYKEFYNIGEYILASAFPVDEVKLKIVGFLTANSYVNMGNGTITLLDRFIILPSFDFNSYQTSEDFTSIYRSLYYIKTDGVIASKYDANTMQTVMNDICSDLDIFPYYYVVGATNQPSYLLGLDMSSMLKILKSITLFIFSFSFIIVSIFTLITIKRNLKYYAILSVNGFTYKDIKTLIVLQPLYIFLGALIISAFIQSFISQYLRIDFYWDGYLILLVVLIVLSVIVGLIGIINLKKYDISMYLRKR